MSLPHRFPFEFVDRVEGRAARLRLSAGSWWRGEEGLGLPWLVEAAAQATARLCADELGEEEMALGGVEGARLDRAPGPGATIDLVPRIERRLGDVTRARVAIEVDGVPSGEIGLLVVRRARDRWPQGSK